MRKLLILIILALPIPVFAQTGVVAVHPANNQGRTLSMEEAVMGVGTRPATIRAMWIDNDTYAVMDGREIKAFKASTGEAVEYKPAGQMGAQGGRPGGRGGVMSSAGVPAYTKGQSLYINNGGEICVAAMSSESMGAFSGHPPEPN